ncbi:MAG: hypothetical protein WC389_08085 [Lutibacter sp.]|jgi:hypothetical protein
MEIRKMKTLILTLSIAGMAIADIPDNNDLADAIFQAEGGYKAEYLYGIRSVKYKDEADARRICLNTIRNNKVRFLKQDKYKDYLEFLANRYCPAKGKSLTTAEKKLNCNWLKNVRYFLAQRKRK